MILDIKTLLILYLLINIASLGTMAIVWHQNRKHFAGISLWLIHFTLQVIGTALLIMRGLLADFISIVVSNTMLLVGIVIIFMGLERFVGEKSRQIHNYILLAFFVFVYTYFTSIQPSLVTREIVLSAIIVIFTFQCCWLLFRRVSPAMRSMTRLTGIAFACYVIVNLFRFFMHILYPSQNNDFFKSGIVDALSITMYIIIGAFLIMTLILMVNRRLLGKSQDEHKKYVAAFDSSPYAIILTRMSDGNIFEVNQSFTNLTGYSSDEVVGNTTLDLNFWETKKDRIQIVNAILNNEKVRDVELKFRKKSGEMFYGLYSADVAIINNEKCVLANIVDITRRKQMEQELLNIAKHDTLTGLPNRMLFYELFDVAMANALRNKKKLAMMYIDVDKLKAVNDSLGHDSGDKVLSNIAERLTNSLRKVDVVARFGGDEFVVLLGEINSKDDAITVAEKILEAFRKPLLVDSHTLNVTVSIGIALFPEDDKDINGLIRKSDNAMYKAKVSGRNNFRLSANGTR